MQLRIRLGQLGITPAERQGSLTHLLSEVPAAVVAKATGYSAGTTAARAAQTGRNWPPRANAFAERFVRTVRIECLDWLLVRNERHLERVLVEFVDHYNEARPHRGIDLEVPAPYTSKALFDDSSRITRVDRLGGLIREYSVAA
jgi:hypothetical protein